jgi:hypothetical protein
LNGFQNFQQPRRVPCAAIVLEVKFSQVAMQVGFSHSADKPHPRPTVTVNCSRHSTDGDRNGFWPWDGRGFRIGIAALMATKAIGPTLLLKPLAGFIHIQKTLVWEELTVFPIRVKHRQ